MSFIKFSLTQSQQYGAHSGNQTPYKGSVNHSSQRLNFNLNLSKLVLFTGGLLLE